MPHTEYQPLVSHWNSKQKLSSESSAYYLDLKKLTSKYLRKGQSKSKGLPQRAADAKHYQKLLLHLQHTMTSIISKGLFHKSQGSKMQLKILRHFIASSQPPTSDATLLFFKTRIIYSCSVVVMTFCMRFTWYSL